MNSVHELRHMTVYDRNIKIGHDKRFVHLRTIDLDLLDCVAVYKVYGEPTIVLANDGRGFTKNWNYFQVLSIRGLTHVEANEAITSELRLAQEDLVSRKYEWPESAERLEMLRRRTDGKTRNLNNDPIYRTQFLREPPGEGWRITS